MIPAEQRHAFSWSEWQLLPFLAGAGRADVLAEILDGGQAFRWNRQPGDVWLGVWAGCVAEIRLTKSGCEWRAPAALESDTAREIGHYFAVEQDHAALADLLPWRSDPHLARCLQAFPGLRILRQPFGETLLGFLCSATKQIVQIKQMLALLAERHGSPLSPDGRARTPLRAGPTPDADPATIHPREGGGGKKEPVTLSLCRLPTWAELAQVPEADLRACLLGFRARHIHQTARFLAAHPGWLEATEALPYAEAKARLCSLPGVGEKIADCVLLFGAGRLEAFPVDVWIIRTMSQRYGLHGWKPAQVAHFGRTHFGPLAGLAQQYLFAYERRAAGR
jgi:N-glycosylase/DNA lyase